MRQAFVEEVQPLGHHVDLAPVYRLIRLRWQEDEIMQKIEWMVVEISYLFTNWACRWIGQST